MCRVAHLSSEQEKGLELTVTIDILCRDAFHSGDSWTSGRLPYARMGFTLWFVALDLWLTQPIKVLDVRT